MKLDDETYERGLIAISLATVVLAACGLIVSFGNAVLYFIYAALLLPVTIANAEWMRRRRMMKHGA